MKLLVVDDHALFREGLCHVLESLAEEVSIFEAADYDAALVQIDDNIDLDLVLLDLNMPGKDGFTLLEYLTMQYPATPVVILSASNDFTDLQRSLKAGAMGFIPKETTSSVMLNALRMILSGNVYVPANMVAQNQDEAEQFALTTRQQEVLALMVLGHSNKAIAAELQLAEATVKMHVTAILKSLGVRSRTQAVLLADKKGFPRQQG